MNRRRILLLATLWVAIATLYAQPAGRKGYTLRGKVEQVNESTKSLTVAHEKVEGWMDAMTMTYAVDKEETLKHVKAGDQITATVYDGDYTLHDIKVVTPEKKK